MQLISFLSVFTIISLPLYIIRCDTFSWCSSPLPITFLEMMILITFSTWFIWKIYSIKKGEKTIQQIFSRFKNPFFYPMLLFLVVATFSIFISPDLRGGAGVWKAYFVEPILLYLVILDLSLEKRSINWIIYSLILSGTWVSLLAIWQSFTQENPFAPNSIIWGRVTGVYDNPNALALFLGPIMILSYGLIFEKVRIKNLLERNLFLISILIYLFIQIWAIYLSKSRGGLLGILFCSIFFLLVYLRDNYSKRLQLFFQRFLYLMIIIIIIISSIIFLNINYYVNQDIPKSISSVQNRLCIWQGTKVLLEEKPIFGAGLDGFHSLYPNFATCEKYTFKYPHNIILNFWTEIGIVGLFIFFWLSYQYYAIVIKGLTNPISVALLSVLIYFFVHGLVDVPYFKNDLSVLFWIFIGLVAFMKDWQSTPTNQK